MKSKLISALEKVVTSNTKIYRELLGNVFDRVYRDTRNNGEKDGDVLIFEGGDKSYMFYHKQDCCEDVRIEDITGDLEDLEGSAITQAEEVIEEGNENNPDPNYESSTWTFYKFATKNGYVTVRWLGESNGHYSETVDFKKL